MGENQMQSWDEADAIQARRILTTEHEAQAPLVNGDSRESVSAARYWEAIAAGFVLPMMSVRGVVWPAFWRRSAWRCGRVTWLYDSDGNECEGCAAPSRHPRPNFPWLVPRHHLYVMLKAASIAQTNRRVNGQQCGTSWLDALGLCETTLDADIDHWVSGMTPQNAAYVRELLSSWDAAPEPVVLLDSLTEQYGKTTASYIHIDGGWCPSGVPWTESSSMKITPAPWAAALETKRGVDDGVRIATLEAQVAVLQAARAEAAKARPKFFNAGRKD